MSFKPTPKMREAAKTGLAARKKYKRGGLDNKQASSEGVGSGVQRASDIVNGKALTLETVKRMRAFFSRHKKNYKPDVKMSDGGPTAGTIAYLLWGGTDGALWSENIVAQEARDSSTASGVCVSSSHSVVSTKKSTSPHFKSNKITVAVRVHKTAGLISVEGAYYTRAGEAAGKGSGLPVYEKAIADVVANGYDFGSDATVSLSSLRLWQALSDRGWNVIVNPRLFFYIGKNRKQAMAGAFDDDKAGVTTRLAEEFKNTVHVKLDVPANRKPNRTWRTDEHRRSCFIIPRINPRWHMFGTQPVLLPQLENLKPLLLRELKAGFANRKPQSLQSATRQSQ